MIIKLTPENIHDDVTTIKITKSMHIHLIIAQSRDFHFHKKIVLNLLESNIEAEFVARIIAEQNAFIDLEVVIRTSKSIRDSQILLDMKAVLQDDSAKVSLIPTLEINNREIIANHKVAISSFDNFMLEYMRSRGLSIDEAKDLLLSGFIKPI